MPEILVIGSLNADLVVRAPRFPQPGETISGEDLQIMPGGKGANQAVAAARQGMSVAMAGRVGKDSFGPFLINSLKSNQVDASHVVVDDSATGTAIIVVDSSGQNSIVLSPGANGQVSTRDIDTLHLEARTLLLQLEIPIQSVIHAAKWGKEKCMTVILNPAPARDLPNELISSVDHLLPNETELSLLSGVPVKDTASAEKAARVLIERGARNIIVTLGSDGALIVSNKITKHVQPFKVDVIDTTAAGDAFIGGFASALLSGTGLEETVRYANACGALAVTKFGAQPSLPTNEDTERFMSFPYGNDVRGG